MNRTKLHSISNTMKKYGEIWTVDKLVKLNGNCTRRTVYNLIKQINQLEGHERKIENGKNVFRYFKVSKPQNFRINEDLNSVEKSLESFETTTLKALKKWKNTKIPDNLQLNFMDVGVSSKRSLIRLQQKMTHFEAIGLRTTLVEKRFSDINDRLFSLDLEIHKALFRIDKDLASNVYIRIDYELSENPKFD